MKKIFIAVTTIIIGFAANAQVMQAKSTWITIKVPQMKCWECKQRLEKYLTQEKGPDGDAGIMQWNINMNNATVRIQYYSDRMTPDYLRTAIANAGFDADSIKAEADSYKLLPNVCKKKEDGGGATKGCNLPPEDRVGMLPGKGN